MNQFAMILLAAAILSPSAHAKGKPGKAVLMETSEIKWSDVPGFPGVHMATVDGDAGKSASHNFMKFDAGFSAPMHHHTADHFVSVISGTIVLTVDGKEHKLPSGSYFAFTGKAPHATACAAGADCVIFVDARSKWDVIPEKK